jgi:feruloyl-CoA synthase
MQRALALEDQRHRIPTMPAVSDMPWRQVRLGDLTPIVEPRADGATIVRAAQPLGPYPVVLTDRLAHWAGVAPDRTLLSWLRPRADRRCRETLTFAAAYEAVRNLGQALLDRGVSADRPLVILSGNDVHHILLSLAAQHAGVPYAPISPAYSLVSREFAALRHVMGLLSPGLIFVADRGPFERALAAVRPILADDVEIVTAGDVDRLAATPARGDIDRRHAAILPDAVAKILFTSGSTGAPKGVVNTHRMLCSNQQMILQTLPFLGDEPPVLVDWLPWHHTFGGNHNIGIVVYNGGSLHVDDGRPLPGQFEESVRNLQDIAPTLYLNVPKGYEELVGAMRANPDFARHFFGRVRVLFYAAASLSQHVSDELQSLAVEACGERLVLVTGLGSTETAPMAVCRPWPSDLASAIGLPVPGVEVKLAPCGEKLEVRVRGPNVTPGYWRQDALTHAAFDDEGYYCMGDAVRLDDDRVLSQGFPGFFFDGRIKEDFKLSSGTWVSVGPLRARIVQHFAPFLRDAVITGEHHDTVGMLAVPDVEACRQLCGDLRAAAPAADVLRHPAVRARLQALLDDFSRQATGSASRVTRALVLEEPPSLDAGEITDKGSLNQRAMIARRHDAVDALYAPDPPPAVIVSAARSVFE